jgi:hypothetical protein
MEIIQDLEAKQEILDRMATLEFGNRTGIHQSDLVFCLNKAYLRRVCPKKPKEHEVLRMARGTASQRWLTRKLEDEPTVELDGIQVTPDALWKDGTPWELKETDASSTREVLGSVHYVRQLMNQCKVLGVRTARLSRLFNLGNWKWVYKPKDPAKIQALVAEFGEDWEAHPLLDVTRFEFTQEEIDRNWEMMKARRDLLLKLLDSQALLPKPQALMSGMDWECKDCPYRGKECNK